MAAACLSTAALVGLAGQAQVLAAALVLVAASVKQEKDRRRKQS